MKILYSKESPQWLRRLSAVALVNFAAFVIVALLIGGDAFSGREEAGRYFVARGGQYTEVTEAVFYYSRVHFIVAPLTLFVALVCALFRLAQKHAGH